MFTLEQIQQAHSYVKTWADFPAYVQALIKLGVTTYDTFVDDVHAVYKWWDQTVSSQTKLAPIDIAENSDPVAFAQDLKSHQQGQTDFATFREDAARSGVYKRTMDIVAMTCTYYDKQGNIILSESVPTV